MNATNEIISGGDPLPTIAHVEKANGPFDLAITWATGRRGTRTDIIDVAPQIFTYKVYRPLRDDREFFTRVGVSDDGTAVIWPGLADLEISADALEELADDTMTSQGFSQFLRDMEWTFEAAASQLGISRRLVAYYARERAVPRYIALACEALRHRAPGKNVKASPRCAPPPPNPPAC